MDSPTASLVSETLRTCLRREAVVTDIDGATISVLKSTMVKEDLRDDDVAYSSTAIEISGYHKSARQKRCCRESIFVRKAEKFQIYDGSLLEA